MKKQDLITKLSTKKGFKGIISDELASDTPAGKKLEKRFFLVESINTDGTVGISYVYYLYDIEADEAQFYNAEPEKFDNQEDTKEVKRRKQLETHLKNKYLTYFVLRQDSENDAIEADVYTLTGETVTKKTVIAVRNADKTINDFEVI